MNVFLSTISFKSRVYIPYATGCLISYCLKDEFFKQNFNFIKPEYRPDPLQFENFHERLKKSDIIGLTCFVWNQSVNDRIAKTYKSYRPDGIVLYGGPNVPGQEEDAKEYANNRPYVDLFFYGPGERNFKNFLKDYYFTKNLENHEGSYTANNFNITISKEDYVVTETPDPYSDGIFDEILKEEQELAVVIETNRGCPYRCTFCDWGSLTASKVYKFNMDIIKSNIDYVMKFDSVKHINITDANFGMFARDVEIIDYLYESKIRHNKEVLELLFGGMAKNGSTYVKEIYKKIEKFTVDVHSDSQKHNTKNMRVSFQTLSKEALEVVNRKNIKTEKLLDSLASTTNKTLSSELIIGLPGETPESWLSTLEQNINLNLEFIAVYHLVVLPNTPMYDKEYRKKYNIKFTRVYIPEDLNNLNMSDFSNHTKNLFNYKTEYNFNKDTLNFNTYEIMNSCYSYTTEELKLMYLYYFWVNTFWNSRLLSSYIQKSNMSIKEQVKMFFKFIDEGKMPFFKSLIENYKFGLDKIFNNSSVVVLDDLYTVIFLQKSMGRGTELIDIVENLDKVKSELSLIYPNFDADHITQIPNKPRLLSAYVTLVK